VVDAATGSLHPITEHPGDEYSPAWSPDGERIAYMANRESPRDLPADLHTVRWDGTDHERLTEGVDGGNWVSWQGADSSTQGDAGSGETADVPPDCPPESPGSFDLSLTPSSGPSGTTVTITGRVPYRRPGDQGLRGPDDEIRIEVWWNADSRRWVDLLPGRNPTAAAGGPVEMVLDADLTGRCSFSTELLVPDSPPGSFELVAIQGSGASWTLWDELSFVVTD
jgi:hypothetical protein